MSDPVDSISKPIPPFGRWLMRAVAAQPAKLTWKDLATQSGLSYSYLIQLKNGHERPTPRAIALLESVLGTYFATDTAPDHAGTPGVVLFPVMQPIAESPWLVPVSLREPVLTERLPCEDAFFIIQPDNGLMPSVPAGALCLTDPRQRYALSTPGPLLIRLADQAPTGRLCWQSARGLHMQPAGGIAWSRASQEAPQQDPGSVEILGRLMEVRCSLGLSPAPSERLHNPTFV